MSSSTPLINAGEVLRDAGRLRLVDCCHDLANPDAGLQQFAAGHLPRAVHAHLDRDLSGAKSGRNGRHPLPEVADFVRWLGAQGIGPDDDVVAYDRSGGMFAARLWWLLRWIGHDRVRVLDGGLTAWTAAGGALSTTAAQFTPRPYPAVAARGELCVDAAFVLANIAGGAAVLVDARAVERYAGEVEPLDPRAGHIPGALNRPFMDNLDATGHFKPPATLAAEWRALLGERALDSVVGQCGSGVTACHNLLALEHAGLGLARLYPGSWSEWCSDPARPVATGR